MDQLDRIESMLAAIDEKLDALCETTASKGVGIKYKSGKSQINIDRKVQPKGLERVNKEGD